MKHNLLRLVVFVMVFAMLAGACAPAAATTSEVNPTSVPPTATTEPTAVPQKPVTITVWTEFTADPKTSLMDDWIKGFEALYPNITVEHKGISNDVFAETLRTGMLGGSPPDLFILESRAETMEYADADLLYDLTSWYNEREDRFIPGYEFNTVVNGVRYAIPYTVLYTNMIWYNPALLSKYDIDGASISTWDQLMAACDKLKQNDVACFQLGGGSVWPAGHIAEFLIQHNLSVDDQVKLAKGEMNWTDPKVVAALAHLQDMYEAGYFQSGVAADTRDVSLAAFYNGQSGFFSAGSWQLYNKGASGVPADFEFNFIPFPAFSNAPQDNVVIATSNVHWAVAKKSKNIDATLLFLDYITGLPQAENWVKGAQEFLAIRGSVNDNTAGPEMVAIQKWVEAGHVENMFENYFKTEVVSDGIWAGAQGVLSGQLTADSWAKLISDTQASAGNLDF